MAAQQTVMIVDPDALTRHLMSVVLGTQGFCVIGVAELSLRLVQHHAPALVILDLHSMRPYAAMRLINAIRNDPALRAIPIIVCSASPLYLTDANRWLRAHDCRILEKPFVLDDFLSFVEHALLPAQREVGAAHERP